MERRFAKDKISDITTTDLLDALYGTVQSLIEAGAPDNVMFNYLIPPVGYGLELGAYLDINRRVAKDGEEGFTAQQMMPSAVNLAQIVDFVPTVGGAPVTSTMSVDGVVNFNSLIASGRSISGIYKSVLDNCRVIDNALSEADKAEADSCGPCSTRTSTPTCQRCQGTPEVESVAEPSPELDDDALLSGLTEVDDFDLDHLLSDGLDTGDFLANPDTLSKPTPIMQLYQALEARYDQVRTTQGLGWLSYRQAIHERVPSSPMCVTRSVVPSACGRPGATGVRSMPSSTASRLCRARACPDTCQISRRTWRPRNCRWHCSSPRTSVPPRPPTTPTTPPLRPLGVLDGTGDETDTGEQVQRGMVIDDRQVHVRRVHAADPERSVDGIGQWGEVQQQHREGVLLQ